MSELLHDKSNKMTCSPSEYSDKPGHPLSLWSQSSLSAWRTLGPYSLPLSAQWRLWSDWMDAQSDMSLRWVHISFCLFCHASAQMVLMNTAIFSFSNTDNGWVRVLPLFNSISVISRRWKGEQWKALCNEAPFRFGKNLASSGIQTRDPVIRSRER